MKVTIKPLKGETFEVEYELETLVKDFKAQIETLKPDMPAEGMKLIYAGKILNNDQPMKDYGIKEGEFLVVMIAKAKAPAPAAPAAAPAAATPATPAPAAAGGDATAMAASAMPAGNAAMEATIEQLMQMGFEREQVERCLRASFGNPDRAVEYLMSGIPDSIGQEDAGAAPPGGAAPPAGGAAPPAAGGGGGPGGGAAFPAMPGRGGAFPAMPTGGGGGGGGGATLSDADLPPALAALRQSPQFAQLAQLVSSNPGALQQMLPALAASNPAAAQAVAENPEIFMRMLQEAAAGGGGGGRGMPGGGGMPGMPGGMNAQMAQQIADNPEMLAGLADEIAQSDPALAEQLRSNPQAMVQLMQAMAAGGGMPGMPGGGGGGGPPGGGQVVRLTEEEGQAVARLCELGFDRQIAAQAYLACDKNEELAANYLFEHGADD